MRIAVHLQRDIARIHFYDPEQSSRAIARTFELSPNTVNSLRALLRKAELPWSQLQELDDAAWRTTLGTVDRSIAQRKPVPDWAWVHDEMQRPDATLEVLWRDWRIECPEGIGYTQFTLRYRKWTRSLNIVMRQHHAPGSQLFVDFAGRTMEILGASGEPSLQAQIFVAVLGYSNFTYVRAVASQRVADWVACHVDCFETFGGVPKWVVSDNLKAAVWRRERHQVVINPTFRECLTHYGTAALPARGGKPRDKGKVEVGVQIAQRWILFRLRDRTFFSLAELNAEIDRLTAALNDHAFKKMDGSRRQRFEEVEQRELRPLPQERYELCEWRFGVRVGDDYHIEHAGNYYSVPYERRGERADLRFSNRLLEVLIGGRRIAAHAIPAGKGLALTQPEHRPIAHQRVLEGEPRAIAEWADRVGSSTAAMIRHHLEQRADATNGLKTARRLRDLSRLYGERRIEEVCAYALPLNITALRSLESILKQGADKRQRTAVPRRSGDAHEYLRGPGYFGEPQ